MPGVVFVILVPTANFEKTLALGNNALDDDENNELNNCTQSASQHTYKRGNILTPGGNNLNINQPEYNTAVVRLEVELRDKNDRQKNNKEKRGYLNTNNKSGNVNNKRTLTTTAPASIPMEKVLEELLRKLNIEHVTWTIDKYSNYIQVIFPLQSGERCETTLHCLTELGIGINLNSNISVLPCSVSYDAIKDLNDFDESSYEQDGISTSDEYSKWNNFVESIKSKLTVKQVVDGVRAGGSLSFDYILLIVTADSLAALGLVENNAPNIVAAMLVSPLMGPVMSITFGAIISDRELMKVGFMALGLGIFISILFGFIFGLILGTTEQPWGFGDWPTEEMKGRGNARSLWMGILWALTSGTGVAVALLQGSAGPLIGVAISASLLPPVVNCGLFWALACIWLIYDGVKIPHIKGEQYTGNTTYVPIYTNYIPVEFLINGIVSALLTVVNVICIFITAIIVLKIKEVAAPYTSSPDLRRFWETDIRAVRKTNRSTIRYKTTGNHMMSDGRIPQNYEDVLNKTKTNANLGQVLEQAIREAVDDETYQKVKRVSYASHSVGELAQRLQLNSTPSSNNSNNIATNGLAGQSPDLQNSNAIRNSKMTADLVSLDKLITSLLLLDRQTTSSPRSSVLRKHLRRSLRHGSARKSQNTTRTSTIIPGNSNDNLTSEHVMPTILETGRHISENSTNDTMATTTTNLPAVRRVLNTIANASHRLSQSIGTTVSSSHQRNNGSEEHINLTMENIHDLNNK